MKNIIPKKDEKYFNLCCLASKYLAESNYEYSLVYVPISKKSIEVCVNIIKGFEKKHGIKFNQMCPQETLNKYCDKYGIDRIIMQTYDSIYK